MNIATIGTILRERIREKGYTQEEFCEKLGIGLSSLKKYMTGKVYYSIDTLNMFAEALDCSYDYLLGVSKTPKPELHEVKELTRLQDDAIEHIQHYAKEYDSNPHARQYLDTLSYIVSNKFLVERIIDYLYIDGNEELLVEQDEMLPQPGIHIGKAYLNIPEIEDAYLLGITKALVKTKEQIKRKDDVV